MVGTHIVSKISGEDYKRTLKGDVLENPRFWILLVFFAGFTVFYLGDFIYTFVAERKIDVFDIVFLALFIFFLVNHILDPQKKIELYYARLIQFTGSSDIIHDITFEEDRIVMISQRDGKPEYTPYDQNQKLLVYPEYVVLISSTGGIYITRDNLPDWDKFTGFMLAKSPKLKIVHRK